MAPLFPDPEYAGWLGDCGEQKLVNLFSSDHIWYSARQRSDDLGFRWHNGDVLILDEATAQVWLSSWDL